MKSTLLQVQIPVEYKRYLKISSFDRGITITKYIMELIERDMECGNEKEKTNE